MSGVDVLAGITHTPGDLIGLSAGEYSDYRFNGLYAVLADIDLGALAVEYASAAVIKDYYRGVPEDEREPYMYELSDSGFGAFLVARGLVTELSYDEVHCGSWDFEAVTVNQHMSTRRAALARVQP